MSAKIALYSPRITLQLLQRLINFAAIPGCWPGRALPTLGCPQPSQRRTPYARSSGLLPSRARPRPSRPATSAGGKGSLRRLPNSHRMPPATASELLHQQQTPGITHLGAFTDVAFIEIACSSPSTNAKRKCAAPWIRGEGESQARADTRERDPAPSIPSRRAFPCRCPFCGESGESESRHAREIRLLPCGQRRLRGGD